MSWNDAPDYTPQLGWLHIAIGVAVLAGLGLWLLR